MKPHYELGSMGLLAFLRQLKRKPSTELRACPSCLGLNLNRFLDSTSGWLSPQRYFCQDCGYFGYGYIAFDESVYLEQIKRAMET